MKKILTLFLILFMSIFISCNKKQDDPKENQENNNVFGVVSVESDAIKGEKLELALYEKELKIESEGNPYDYSYMKVMVEFTSPSGEVTSALAFWYQGYQITLNTLSGQTPTGISGTASTSSDEVQGTELVSALGDPHYRVRFMPKEAGIYQYRVMVYKNGELYSVEHEGSVQVMDSSEEYQGILQVDQTTNRNFCFSETGKTFVTVGENLCWYTSSTRKAEDYAVWFEKFQENNMNTTRLWLANWGFAIHSKKSLSDYSSRYSAAARLDKVVELADEYNIYFMLCLINHGQFSDIVNAEWDTNPYNSANGGMCDTPLQFFINEEAKAAYKNELLYLIARYGYSNNILSWELFNEVDWVDGYQLGSSKIKAWHDEMAKFIKENDPHHHMVSTSFKGTDGSANVLESIDFVSPHDYSYTGKNMIINLSNTENNLAEKYNKPVLVGEIGLNSNNGYNNYTLDRTGTSLHQAQWAGMMGGGAGGAMNWWWDSYVHPYNLYYQFKGAGAFSKLMDLSGSDYSLIGTSYTSNNSNLNIMGYKFTNRMYGYIYDASWTYYNTSIISKTNVSVTIPFSKGTYTVELYDTSTGAVISSKEVTSNGEITIDIDSVQYDIAFIVK